MLRIYEQLGFKIRKYRKQKNYSTYEFAKRIGVSAGLINNIENGKNDVFKLELLIKIANDLDLTLSDLLDITSLGIETIDINSNFSTDVNNSVSEENAALINSYINQIIQTYLTCILNHGCNEKVIKSVGNHIIDDINFIKKI